MSDIILVINAGSSSLKFATFRAKPDASPERTAYGEIDCIGIAPHLVLHDHTGAKVEDRDIAPLVKSDTGHQQALAWLIGWLGETAEAKLVAVGHRVVHGGDQFTQPVRMTPEVLRCLEDLVPMAPMHQPHNLSAARVFASLRPSVPQFACFDTGFHATQPWVAQAFALPSRVSGVGVRRYGFHGLSYEYIASVLPQHLGSRAVGRVVVAHLGNGASLCAMHRCQSVATTMGFTALDGLMMGTRCGNLDPGVLLFLMGEKGMTLAEVEKLLYHESGLLGVSGVSPDMRILEASDQVGARKAIDLYVYRIVREMGSLVAVLGGIDALIFTAGIGEHSMLIRQRVCQDVAWLGVDIDENANHGNRSQISTVYSRVSAWVIPTNEELMIARHTLNLLTHRRELHQA